MPIYAIYLGYFSETRSKSRNGMCSYIYRNIYIESAVLEIGYTNKFSEAGTSSSSGIVNYSIARSKTWRYG